EPLMIAAPRVSQGLREEGLISGFADRGGADTRGGGDAPMDITQHPMSFPAPRSARLQALARAETGFLSGLAYAGIRGFGPAHPTVGELRSGALDVLISHPLLEGECWYAGSIIVTEVESLFPEETAETKRDEWEDPLQAMKAGQGEKADASDKSLSLGIGYGLVFGRNDNKAIAMSVMDYLLSTEGEGILQNQEFVLLHGDCLEMSGFLSHLKLPHYVTFQSKLDRVRHTRTHTRKEARE
ncbi:MAG: carbon-phosphorus lyase complex subunit PhnI, partial [Peptococcaceae bacterium]|nr:carbon-phosphorus lyase complex subunit PhnI [Peptococcaceae bacterium]